MLKNITLQKGVELNFTTQQFVFIHFTYNK